jgi:WD40 repeat protein
VWRYRQGSLGAYREFTAHSGAVYDLAFDPEGQRIASAGEDALIVWSVDSLQVGKKQAGDRRAVRLLDDKPRLVYADTEGVVLVDLMGKRGEYLPLNTIHVLLSASADHVVLEASPDGKWIAAAFADYYLDPPVVPDLDALAIRVVNVENPDEAVNLTGHEGPVSGLAFHPTKPILASTSHDQTVRVWDYKKKLEIRRIGDVVPLDRQGLFADSHDAIIFSPDGKLLLNGLALLPFPALEPMEILSDDHIQAANAATFFPDGERIITGHVDGAVRIWDVRTRQPIARFSAFRNSSPVYGVAVSPDRLLVATCGRGTVGGFTALGQKVPVKDTTVRVWRVRDLLTE